MTHKTKRKADEKLDYHYGFLLLKDDFPKTLAKTSKEIIEVGTAKYGRVPVLLFATFHSMKFNPESAGDSVRAYIANEWTEEQFVKNTIDGMSEGYAPFALITLLTHSQLATDQVALYCEAHIICGWNWSPERIRVMCDAAIEKADQQSFKSVGTKA
jgi:hypothetical protein